MILVALVLVQLRYEHNLSAYNIHYILRVGPIRGVALLYLGTLIHSDGTLTVWIEFIRISESGALAPDPGTMEYWRRSTSEF